MGIKRKFKNRSFFIDTAPIIYFMESNNPVYLGIMREFFKQSSLIPFRISTSAITLTELLVKPYTKKRNDLIEKYKSLIIDSKAINIFNIDANTGDKVAELRALYNIKTPDALQIASALNNKCDFFITNDLALSRVTEIEVLSLNELQRNFT